MQATPSKRFARATDAERNEAKLRVAILNAFTVSGLKIADFCRAFENEAQYEALRASYKKALKPRTLYRWAKDYRENGLDGITPSYSSSSAGAGASLTELEKSLLMNFYLHYNKRSMRHCYLLMKANIPSTATEATCRRFLKSLPADVVCYYRDGTDRYNAKYLPYIEGNKDLYKSLDKVQGDHHILDVLVAKGKQRLRPWITTFVDYASGAVVGFCLSTNPSSQTILAAYYMMITRFGIPKRVHVDNGKDYKSKTIKGETVIMKVAVDAEAEREEEVEIAGAITICGSKLQYARPYHGQSKGVQERFYGTLEQYFGKNTCSYLGSNTSIRVDEQKLLFRAMKGFEKRGDVMSWEECVQAMSAFIYWYNMSFISDAKKREGMTAGQKFIENAPEHFIKPDAQTIELALTQGQLKKVQRNGVRFGGTFYWSKEIMRFVGQEVIARVNLVDRKKVLICDKDGRVLCDAYADVFMETGDLELDNKNLNSVHREIKKQVREDARYALPFKPKTLLDVAIEAVGGSVVPEVSDYIPGTSVEEVKTKKAVGHNDGNGKYKSYFDVDDEDFLRSASQ